MRRLLGVMIHLAGTAVSTILQRGGGEAETNTWPMVFEWLIRALSYAAVPIAVAGLVWYVVRHRSR